MPSAMLPRRSHDAINMSRASMIIFLSTGSIVSVLVFMVVPLVVAVVRRARLFISC